MRIGTVLLAAGLSRRFGDANKLLADVCGRPMAACAMDVQRSFDAERHAVVASDGRVAELARQRGMEVVANDAPELGMAHSIVLGVNAMRDMDAVLLMAADQPKLTAASLQRLVSAFETEECPIACLMDGTHYGNPAIFSKEHFGELLALSGDRGAKVILRKHEELLRKVPCVHAGELADADDPAALESILSE